jgi:hypothetical protein
MKTIKFAIVFPFSRSLEYAPHSINDSDLSCGTLDLITISQMIPDKPLSPKIVMSVFNEHERVNSHAILKIRREDQR